MRSQKPPVPPQQPENEPPGDQHRDSQEIINNLKLGAVAAACGGLGYAGSVAHAIPYVGPAISGVAGAIVGASAGASLASVMPGQRIKTGALLGAISGAIVGASGGGTLAGNVAMGVAGATAPYGLLLAVFSGAS
ncbi:MAG: hypothetical protein KF760_21625 [Candidatus Eremiobacteraeota bacterium]|nr:hypothetical protein [Candidatus Eremiobacteraeota bacterium]MCW5872699.1 hypothetical protein [Candidatus Eremiobacteraeota bacterium]